MQAVKITEHGDTDVIEYGDTLFPYTTLFRSRKSVV